MDFMNYIIDDTPNVSVITKIEVLGFEAPKEEINLLREFMSDSCVLDLNDHVVNRCIEIRKENKIKLPDAIIAASALVFEMTLITRNTDDFKNIKELDVINPWNL
jgi:predicted nucleic acid-binding protein